MAILTGINTKLRGSIGSYTYARLNGQTVVKEKIESTENPSRTARQMAQRMQWANLVALYQAFDGNLHPSFEKKDKRVSDYNAFMSANLGLNKVYLPSDVARQGGCVVAGYQVTRGSLPSVTYSFGDGGIPVTDIAMGGMTIGASTTVATFSRAIVENNPDWQYGDQLTVFVAHQTQDGTTGVPRVKIEAVEITLDRNDSVTLLGEVVDANFFTVAEGKLTVGGTVNGAIAVIHSRLTVSGTKVSTQFFVVNNTLLAQYQTTAAYEAAAKSYGYDGSQAFLTPNVEDIAAETPMP